MGGSREKRTKNQKKMRKTELKPNKIFFSGNNEQKSLKTEQILGKIDQKNN
jgi:hypothetical protein